MIIFMLLCAAAVSTGVHLAVAYRARFAFLPARARARKR